MLTGRMWSGLDGAHKTRHMHLQPFRPIAQVACQVWRPIGSNTLPVSTHPPVHPSIHPPHPSIHPHNHQFTHSHTHPTPSIPTCR